ncbi:MAG: hypothetical protein RL684_38, partial [Pseudomonadota bacterium]
MRRGLHINASDEMQFKRKRFVGTSPNVVEGRFLPFLLWSILALGPTHAFAQTLSD